MSVEIIGAGLAGLLAANMLRDECAAVYEAQERLPNNHSAVLRFRSPIVGDTLGIPFRKVRVLKASHRWRNPIADAVAYSMKTNGSATLRSSAYSEEPTIEDRWIAPPDLIGRMAARVNNLLLGMKCKYNSLHGCPIISTMPMSALMGLLDWKQKPEFKSRPGANVTIKLRDVDLYGSLYVPNPEFPGARISITGDEMVVECYREITCLPTLMEDAVKVCGIDPTLVESWELKEQKYAKILPIDETIRRRFILWASEEHNVYSLGRFATWRPGLLLDDLVQDVRVIQRLIAGETKYDQKKRG